MARWSNVAGEAATAAPGSEPEAELEREPVPDEHEGLVRKRLVGASDIESAQDAQARKFIEKMTRKGK